MSHPHKLGRLLVVPSFDSHPICRLDALEKTWPNPYPGGAGPASAPPPALAPTIHPVRRSTLPPRALLRVRHPFLPPPLSATEVRVGS